jgi:hypothetical protein
VFYFFEKDRRYLQCEIRLTDVPETFAIIMTEPDGHTRTHFVTGNGELQRRWMSLQTDLNASGWWGPSGRD